MGTCGGESVRVDGMAKLVHSAGTEGPMAVAVHFLIPENPDVLQSAVKISYPRAPEPSGQMTKTTFQGVQKNTAPVWPCGKFSADLQ